MIINNKIWGYKLYRWWLEAKVRARFSWGVIDHYESGVLLETPVKDASMPLLHKSARIAPNFCLYVRVVLLYAPLRKLVLNKYFLPSIANLVVYSFILATLLSESFRLGDGYEISLGTIVLLCMFAAAGLIVGVGYSIQQSWNKLRNKSAEISFTPSIYKTVIKPYVKAKKQKICPMITFEEEVMPIFEKEDSE